MATDYSFLKGVGQQIDMTKDERFTPQQDPNSVSGGTTGGHGYGMFNFDQFAQPGQSFNFGDVNNESGGGFNAGIKVDEAKKWMDSMGYKLNEYTDDSDTGYIYITDKDGNVVGEPTTTDQGLDKAFMGAVLAAAAVVTGGVAAAGYGVGGAGTGAAAGGAGEVAAGGALDLGGGDALAGELVGGSGADAVAGEAITSAAGGTTAPGYSAAANYGPGMTGAQTGMFDGVLAATGSSGAAATATNLASGNLLDAASSAWNWLGSAGSAISSGGSLFSNPLSRDLLKLLGYGVMQQSAENATAEQREWLEKQEADKRRRQMAVKTPGMFFTTSKGRNG